MSETTEAKEACPVCGEMVSTFPPARARHMNMHKQDKAETSAVKDPMKAIEKDLVDQPVKVDTLSGLDGEEKIIMERALAAQENFRKAPKIFLSEDSTDDNAAMIKLYAPECLDKHDSRGKLVKRAAYTAFFADRKKLAQRAAAGYVPVLGDDGKFVTNGGGDVLCRMDRKMHDAIEARPQIESRNMLGMVNKDISKDKVADTPEGDAKDLRNTSLEITRETMEV